jgi:hypothetical protein
MTMYNLESFDPVGWCRYNAVGISLRIYAEAPAIITDNFLGFPQYLHANSGILSRSGQDRFLPDAF